MSESSLDCKNLWLKDRAILELLLLDQVQMSLFSHSIDEPTGAAFFLRQAADYCVTAPFLALASVMCSSSIDNDEIATVVFALIFNFLIVSGFVLGIIALIGTHWYGREGILRKAIAGVCIHAIVMLYLVVGIGQLDRDVKARRMIKQATPTAR